MNKEKIRIPGRGLRWDLKGSLEATTVVGFPRDWGGRNNARRGPSSFFKVEDLGLIDAHGYSLGPGKIPRMTVSSRSSERNDDFKPKDYYHPKWSLCLALRGKGSRPTDRSGPVWG